MTCDPIQKHSAPTPDAPTPEDPTPAAPSAAALAPATALSRRGFLRGVGGAAVAAGFTGLGTNLLVAPQAEAAEIGPLGPHQRRTANFLLRSGLALQEKLKPIPAQPTNGDEELYADLRANYSKGLPHDNLGEVDPAAYALLLAALDSGDSDDFALVPTGGPGRLTNPQAAFAFELVGADTHRPAMPAAPQFASAWNASEIGEVYWQAVTRDVPFADYGSDPLIAQAAADLSGFSDFRGPKSGGNVTPGTLFRGETAGDLVGPYVSQFLWHPIPYGLALYEQRYFTPVDGDDYMTSYGDWLAVQRGILPPPVNQIRGFDSYIARGRDLAEFVHRDFSYQAYLSAALILLGYGDAVLDLNNPYRGLLNQMGFATFGAPDVLDLVSKAGNAALKTAWYQKWLVHRRLRPEVMGGRIHNQVTGAKDYGIHPDILNSAVLPLVFGQHGTYLLPVAFPEGSPTHPAYPAGHALMAGACTTVLKAFFDEDFVIPNPVVADAAGNNLLPWTGADLTVGSELNKLANNISLGRDGAGVHWRTDGTEGVLLGEQIAIEILRDYKRQYTERNFAGFQLTTFGGQTISI